MDLKIAELIMKHAVPTGIEYLSLEPEFRREIGGRRTAAIVSHVYGTGDVGDLLNAIVATTLAIVKATVDDIITRNVVSQGWEGMPITPIDWLTEIRDCNIITREGFVVLY